MYSCKILADSITKAEHRLTTFEVTFPRFILAEVNTHTLLSRSSASSRAIPVEKQLKRIMEDPFVPSYWGKNQKGMQANEELDKEDQATARLEWSLARDQAVTRVKQLLALGVHKQTANRLLEPFMWHTAIITATEFSNFFALRCHPDAQPEFRTIATMMRDAYEATDPRTLEEGQWHLPLIQEDEWTSIRSGTCSWDTAVKISVGRCARASYLTHDGKRDIHADIELADRILSSGHMAPWQHVARPMRPSERENARMYVYNVGGSIVRSKTQMLGSNIKLLDTTYFCGNYQGWVQRRKELPYEWDFSKVEKGNK